VANGGFVAAARAPAAVPEPPRLASFRDVVALVAAAREPLLHGHLVHSVHLIRFAPPVIELRPHPDAPRDLASRLGALLQRESGQRWSIVIGQAAGEPTLAEQGQAADQARRHAAAGHPLVRAILDAFPGARIEAVHDPGVDSYGLPLDMDGPPDMPDFAPPDAEPAELMESDE
jgi:DNA polymerase-3 subunit gamma/tau